MNGRSVGSQPCGQAHRYRADVRDGVRAGAAGGRRAGETAPRSAGPRSARPPDPCSSTRDGRPECIAADPADLAFVTLSAGRRTTARRPRGPPAQVEVKVDGPGVLQAFGSGEPAERRGASRAPRCTTFDGRALAVVRPTGAGRITLTATAEGCDPQQVQIDARA